MNSNNLKFKSFFIIILLVLSAVCSIFTPLQLRRILSSFDPTNARFNYYVLNKADLSQGLNWTKLILDFSVIIGLLVLGAVLDTIANLIANRIAAKYAYSLRSKIRTKYDNLQLSFFDTHQYGELLSIGTNDVDAIASSLNNIITTIISSLAILIGAFIAMFVVNWKLGLVAIATIPLSVLATL